MVKKVSKIKGIEINCLHEFIQESDIFDLAVDLVIFRSILVEYS